MSYLIEYPGLTGLTGNGTISRVRGTSPAVIVVQAGLFNDSLVSVGDLSLYENGALVRRMRDCAYVDMQFESSASGSTVTITLHDRRWRWNRGGGTVSGNYNSRNTDGTVQAESAKSLKELLEICFTQLGETNVDYSDVPAIAEPIECFWDYTRTVDAVNALFSAYGLSCDILADDSVRIILLGSSGATLPDTEAISYQTKFSNLATPDVLKIIAKPVKWQMGFKLRAVGLDLDGKFKQCADLSFAPSGGWGSVEPKQMLGLSTGTSAEDKERRKLAMDHVYRRFEIQEPADYAHAVAEGNDIIPELPEVFGSIDYSWQHVLFENLFTTVDNEDETSIPVKGKVRGVFWAEEYGLENTSATTLYDGDWKIDRENGHVLFPRQMLKLNATGDGYEFPDLYLFCTVSLLNTRRLPYRHTISRQIGVGTNEHARKYEDIELQVTVNYTWSGANERWERTTVTTNETEVLAAAVYYLDAMQQEMAPSSGESRPLEGWHNIELDGEIAQVTWSWSSMAATTQVSKNSEHRSVLPFKVFRQILQSNSASVVEGGKLAQGGAGKKASK